MRRLFLTMALLSIAGLANAEFDGSEPLLCTIMMTHTCDFQGCERAARAGVDGVRHLVVDFDRDRVKSPNTSLQAPISAVTTVDNMLFVSGIVEEGGPEDEDARSWTMAVANPTGVMSLAVAGEDVTQSVLGACTPVTK